MEAPEKVYTTNTVDHSGVGYCTGLDKKIGDGLNEYIRSDLYEQLQKENAELKDELSELELKNHNLIADTYNLKAEAVRDAAKEVFFGQGHNSKTYSAMAANALLIDHAARLEGDTNE